MLISCGTKKWGTPVGLQLRYDDTDNVNYGHSFRIQTILVYSSGKTKDVTTEDETSYQVEGGTLSGGRISCNGYPTSFKKDSVFVQVAYVKKEINYSLTATFPFNYRGDLTISFSGEPGQNGANGDDKGTGLLFRDGKNGEDGLPGGDGKNGSDMIVHIYKDTTNSMYYIRVSDINTSASYFYKNKDLGFPIKLNTTGGRGGDGGSGGSGGDGKDGRTTEEKTKDAGDGGNGGNGGIGGNGGNGGAIYVFIHPTAADIQSRITGFSFPGPAGSGGAGGKAGKAGTPLEGQTPIDGTPGNAAPDGQPGQAGLGIQIHVEDFDIDF